MTGIIKVDTIQNNGGTTGLTIESDGTIKVPQLPAFFVRDNTDSALTFTTQTTWLWDEVVLDTRSGYSTSTGRYTVPVAGVYEFTAFTIHEGGTNGSIRMRKNGTQVANGHTSSGQDQYDTVTVSYIDNFAVNDWVDILAYTSANEQYYGGHWSGFMGKMLG